MKGFFKKNFCSTPWAHIGQQTKIWWNDSEVGKEGNLLSAFSFAGENIRFIELGIHSCHTTCANCVSSTGSEWYCIQLFSQRAKWKRRSKSAALLKSLCVHGRWFVVLGSICGNFFDTLECCWTATWKTGDLRSRCGGVSSFKGGRKGPDWRRSCEAAGFVCVPLQPFYVLLPLTFSAPRSCCSSQWLT